ncbi:hypothetical protein BCR35DRAFT_351402 [Leucosporidium creatinivorum]|uniref:BHLH domain-containing protein n=1 Tax=Leucosporidium creatinivorum TaxID=106004 RepID=A0A1Y2FXW6_9BASI|nr:hypothetical protein BCR35DRAFT_351402 [Leucosporidium creatinivorum]
MDHGSFATEADYSSTGENHLDDLFLDSFSSAHSSGASDGGPGAGAGDYSFDSDLMGSYLAGTGQQNGGGGGGVAVAGYASNQGGQQGFTSSSSASSAAAFSNISSPDYSSYGALSTNNFESLATGSSPPFSFGATVDAGHSNELQQQQSMFDPRSHSLHGSGESTFYGSAATQQQQPLQQQYLAHAPLHHQLSPQVVQQPQQNHFTHFTPQHSANSLSPPSSASSSSGAYQNGYPAAVQPTAVNGGDTLLARMMAEAEAQGRSQADAHAVYASSYMASLAQAQAAPRHSFSNASEGQQHPSAYRDPSSFSGNYPQQSYEDRELGADKLKKRRVVSAREDTSAHQARAQPKARTSTGGSRRPSDSVAPQSQPLAQQQPMQHFAGAGQDGFHFLLHPSVATGGGSVAAALATVPRHAATGQTANTSLNLIANAGVPMTSHRDDASARTTSRQTIAPSSVMHDVSPPPASSSLAVKAGKKVTEKAGAKKPAGGEKRKKGEKGHNAVERRYRNNINNHLAALRDAIPALRHLKPLPSMPASRRRASQFTLSTAAQGPTPAGLVDGVLAAKTLSKGSILGKSIEYIHYLQGARADGIEDIELFKAVVQEMVGGGQALIDVFEQRRAVREEERSRIREEERKEQERLDEEDGSGDENEEDEKAPAVQSFVSQSGYLAPHSGSPHGFPPSPASSSEDPTSISPRLVQHQHYPTHAAGPPRVLLATFMGLSFAGGLGYDWTYSAEPIGEVVGARAWAGRLVRRAAVETSSSAVPSAIVTSDVIHPSLLSGLVFLGISSILVVLLFVAYPLFGRGQRTDPPVELVKSRSAYRQRRRAQALASLAHLNHEVASAPTYLSECRSALKARRELLKLVGAPTYGLLPALCKEGLATLLRKVTTIRVGSFSAWSEEDRIEAAVAWVRIAEIEATVGADEINYLARCYTFLRLFNLSRSTHWPQATSTTTLPAVDAVLSVHLLSLGQPLSAAALWSKARSRDRKKSDTPLHPYAEVAVSTDFTLARSILASTSSAISLDAPARPADTVPLLRISEVRCAAALREAWAKIFVSVIATTCPPQAPLAPLERFSALVDQPFLEETIRHVLESTVEGGTSHTMGKITRSLCRFYAGEVQEGRVLAREVERERATGGPAARLRCVEPFLKLVLDITFKSDDDDEDNYQEEQANTPIADVDLVASSTLGWLLVRRQVLLLPAAVSGKVEPQLHDDTLAIRRMLGHDVFRDETLKAFCSSSSASGREVGDVAGAAEEGGLDLEGALDACLDALTGITRRAAGLRAEDDSGVECD